MYSPFINKQIMMNVTTSKEPLISLDSARLKHELTICCFDWKRFVIYDSVEMGVLFLYMIHETTVLYTINYTILM